jgi:hypothetical protein
MSFAHQKVGPINLASLLIFFFNMAAFVFCYQYFSSKWSIELSREFFMDLNNKIHLVLLYLPLTAVTFFSFISSFVDRSGIVNGKCWAFSVLISVLYTFAAYIIEWDTETVFFAPAMMLLPALYGLVFLTCFFVIWLLPAPISHRR